MLSDRRHSHWQIASLLSKNMFLTKMSAESYYNGGVCVCAHAGRVSCVYRPQGSEKSAWTFLRSSSADTTQPPCRLHFRYVTVSRSTSVEVGCCRVRNNFPSVSCLSRRLSGPLSRDNTMHSLRCPYRAIPCQGC